MASSIPQEFWAKNKLATEKKKVSHQYTGLDTFIEYYFSSLSNDIHEDDVADNCQLFEDYKKSLFTKVKFLGKMMTKVGYVCSIEGLYGESHYYNETYADISTGKVKYIKDFLTQAHTFAAFLYILQCSKTDYIHRETLSLLGNSDQMFGNIKVSPHIDFRIHIGDIERHVKSASITTERSMVLFLMNQVDIKFMKIFRDVYDSLADKDAIKLNEVIKRCL